MLGALFYLRVTSLKNWVRWRARRLRQPKYLVGAIVGIAYFYFFFFRPMGRARPMPSHAMHHGALALPLSNAVPAEWLAIGLAIGAVVLLVILTVMWVMPTERAALGFSEAEIAFLFPAPITRRALVHFRLISGQFRSLTGALVMALISNRWSVLGGNALTHALGWWFIFSTLNLHFSGATFTLTRLADRGFNVVARRLLVLVIVAAIVGITVWRSPPPRIFGPAPQPDFRQIGDWIVDVTAAAPLSWILYPLRAVLGPFLAPDWRTFLLSLAPGLLVIIAHYLWVVRSVVSFEEASIAQAEKRAARIAAWRAGDRRLGKAPTRGRRAPFRLASTGRPELAFLWKNLLSTWPYFNQRVFATAALLIIGVSLWARTSSYGQGFALGAGFSALFIGAYILIIGPQFARQDIRADMRNIDILKTYPLPGWQIVLGELLTPAAILTGVVWLALLGAVLNVPAGRFGWLDPATRGSAGFALAAIVPAVVVLQLLVPNAAAVIFPAWAEATRARGGGPEVMGQRMIYFFAQLVTMIIALLPAAVAAAVLVLILTRLGLAQPLAIIFAGGAVLGVLMGEVALGVWWLGGRFEQIDVSAELRS